MVRLFDSRLGERDIEKMMFSFWILTLADFNMPYIFFILRYTILMRRKTILGGKGG